MIKNITKNNYNPKLPVPTKKADNNVSDFGCINSKMLPNVLDYDNSLWFKEDCFSITLAIDASGCYKTETNSFNVTPGLIFFSSPDTYRQIQWFYVNEIYHITFTERFLIKYAKTKLFSSFPFLILEKIIPRSPSPEILEYLQKIYHQIDREQRGNCPLKKNIIANLLTRLLLLIKRNFWDGYEIQFENNKEQDIARSFIKNLEYHSFQLQTGEKTTFLRVKDYAKMQGIHENYLYNVVKNKTGKVISQWIMERTILVAETLLEDTTLSVKEISYRLGFTYISYFTTFFKKHKGVTPKDFRNTTRHHLHVEITPYEL